MNEIKIFENPEFGKVKDIEKGLMDYFGIVYLLEYGDSLKIGSSKVPYQRLMQLKRNATNYDDTKLGRVAITRPHTNYRENEKRLHSLFESKRKSKTELFDLKLDDVLLNMNEFDLEYKDDSEKNKKKDDAVFNFFKNFVLTGEFH